MSYKNRVTYKDGKVLEFTHTTSEGDAKGWSKNLLNSVHGPVAKVDLVHVADGPYDRSGKVTPIHTLYNKD
jgi:hypothetical protein